MNTYYFASKEDFNNETLYPRIPENRMSGENNTTERICVSKSINGCLSAVQCFDDNDIVYIHQCESNYVIQPTINKVPDVLFTGEEWIFEPVLMKKIMKIKIISSSLCELNLKFKKHVVNKLYKFEVLEVI